MGTVITKHQKTEIIISLLTPREFLWLSAKKSFERSTTRANRIRISCRLLSFPFEFVRRYVTLSRR